MAVVGDTLQIKVNADTKSALTKLNNLNKKINQLNSNMSSLAGKNITFNVNGSGLNGSNGSSLLSNRSVSLLGKLRSGFDGLNKNMKSTGDSSKSLAYYFGKFYANCFLAMRGLREFGKAIKSSMDYIEEYNYFNVTVDKVAGEWSKSFSNYGYDNAESYANSFRDRLTTLIGKMSGQQITDTGALESIQNMSNLGLDITELTNYSAGLMQVTNSLKLTGEASVSTTKALTMLAGDLSSFRNQDLKTVMNNLQSGLLGQSRALYKYGIDITQATLQQYAFSNGISKSVAEMTQSEKMQLRVLAILDQSKVAYGDLANTINSPSNQLRRLRNNFKSLSRTIGGLFMGTVAKVLPYINALTMAIQRLVEWSAKMIGVDLSSIIADSGTGYTSAFEDIADDADDATDNVNDLADATEKYKNQLMGFDKINKLSEPTDTSSKSSGSDKGDTIDLTDSLTSALADYEKAWNDAFNNISDGSTTMADNIVNALKNAFKTGDFTSIGQSIAWRVKQGLLKVDWKRYEKGMKGFARGMATLLNGLFDVDTFQVMGNSVANLINGAIKGSYVFNTTLKWKKIGVSVGKMINGALSGIDWKTAIKSGAALGSGIARALNGFLKTTDFKLVGTTIANALNTAVTTVFAFGDTFDFKEAGNSIADSINGFFQEFDFAKLAQALNKWVNGFLTTFSTAVANIKWSDVFKGIFDFFSNLDISTISVILGAGALFRWKNESVKTTTTQTLGSFISQGIADAGGITALLTMNLPELKESSGSTKLATGGLILGSAMGGYAAGTWLREQFPIIDQWVQTAIKTWDKEWIPAVKDFWDEFWNGNKPEGGSTHTSSDGSTHGGGGFDGSGTGKKKKTSKKKSENYGSLNGEIYWNSFTDGIEEGSKSNNTKNVIANASDRVNLLLRKDFQIKNGTSNKSLYIGNSIPKGIMKGTESELRKTKTKNTFKNLPVNISNIIGNKTGIEALTNPKGNAFVSGIVKGSEMASKSSNTKAFYGRDLLFNLSNNMPNDKINNAFSSKGGALVKGITSGASSESGSSNTKKVFNNKIIEKLRNSMPFKIIKKAFFPKGNAIIDGTISGAKSSSSSSSTKTYFETTMIKKIAGMSKGTFYKDKFINKGSNIIAGIKKGAGDGVDEKKTFFSNTLPSKISNGMGNISFAFNSKGGQIVTGLSSGASKEYNSNNKLFIKNMAEKVASDNDFTEAGKKMANNFVDGWKNSGIKLNFGMELMNKATQSEAGKKLDEMFGMDKLQYNFKFYSGGGMPQSGEMYVARENGMSEFIGRIGNRATVANNDQIVTAVTNGVYEGVAKAMMQYANKTNVNVVLEGDTGKLFKAVQKESQSYTRRTGMAAFT